MIALATSSVSFSAVAGGSSPAAQTVSVTNGGTGTLSGLAIGVITYGGASGWLTATVSATTAPAMMTLTPTTGSLAPASYTATVAITSSASGMTNSPQLITVNLTVTTSPTAPTISLSPTIVNFTATWHVSSPAARTVTVINSGSGTVSGLSIGSINYGGDASGWLAASVSSTNAPATVTLSPTLGTLRPGSYTATVPVRSSASGVTNSPQNITVTFTVLGARLVLTNNLVEPVIFSSNGVPFLTVSPGTTAEGNTNDNPLRISFDLVRPKTNQGVSIGDFMSGIFSTITDPSGTITYVVNNTTITTQTYFAPLITNHGINPILMAVNWGLFAQNLCGCTVPAGGVNVHIGYYRLYTNTEVRAYGVLSGYGYGVYSYWLYSTFQSLIQAGSGAVSLSNSLNLLSPPAGSGPESGLVGALAPSFSRATPPVSGGSGQVYDQAMPNPQR